MWKRGLVVICALVAGGGPLRAQLSFTDITESARTGGPVGPGGLGGHGASFADVNGDGLPDLYITRMFNAPMPELFFRNLGRGRFVEEAAERGIADLDGGSHGGCWADLDNDGDYDLVNGSTWSQPQRAASNNIFRNDGKARFSEGTPEVVRKRSELTRGVACLDMDRDGDLDIFCVTNYQGSRDPAGERNEVYRNDGGWRFTPVDAGDLASCPAGQGVASADIDGDGDVDILAANRTGPVNVLRNDGTGSFSRVDPAAIGIRDPAPDGITSADVDNDGDLDLLLAGGTEAVLYINRGEGMFVRSQAFSDYDGYMGGFADLDNDGDLDLVFAGNDVLYLNDGKGGFEAGPAVPVAGINDPRAIAFADIDNDGDLDFAIGAKRSRNWLVRNEYRGPHHWLKVKLVSPRGQAGAFGARVRIRVPGKPGAGGLLALREAGSCHGYLGQDDPVLHFGLGKRLHVDLDVTFLDGTTRKLPGVRCDQTVVVDGRRPGALDRVGTRWSPFLEWSLENSTHSERPFDLDARVEFRHGASGETRKTGMFLDGSDTWRFRFTATRTGVWTFTTRSEDPDLSGKQGTVVVTEHPDPGAHGFVKHFGNKWGWEGTEDAFVPQLVMYDNPEVYFGRPEKVDRDIRTFLVGHGFNGFHTYVFCRWFDIAKERNSDIRSPVPDGRTFEALELLITRTHAAGGMVHIWQWGDESRRQTPVRWGKNGPVDRRLLRYLAARLGPVPGWTLGYGFDCDEWVTEEDLRLWHGYLHEQLGWSHFLGARDPNPNHPQDPLTQIYEGLDYAGYEHHRPAYRDYVRALEARPSKPCFSEDRFRVRVPPRYPKKDYNEELTRRGLYDSTLAGGVANIWGTNVPGGWTAGGGSKPYRIRELILTYAEFFRGRFTSDMERANQLTSGVCLARPTGRHFVFYGEDAAAIRMDLSGMKGPQPAVAVDTKKPYREISCGVLAPAKQTWKAPYASDWAIAVGVFARRGEL